MSQQVHQTKNYLLSEADVQRIREGKPLKPRKPLSPEHRAKLAAGLARRRAAEQTAKSQPLNP